MPYTRSSLNAGTETLGGSRDLVSLPVKDVVSSCALIDTRSSTTAQRWMTHSDISITIPIQRVLPMIQRCNGVTSQWVSSSGHLLGFATVFCVSARCEMSSPIVMALLFVVNRHFCAVGWSFCDFRFSRVSVNQWHKGMHLLVCRFLR